MAGSDRAVNVSVTLSSGSNTVNSLSVGSGAALTVNSGASLTTVAAGSNAGTIDITGSGSTLALDLSTMSGTIDATSAGVLTLSGSGWTNTGLIQATGSTVNLGGSFTQAGLGSFSRDSASTVNLTGTLDGSLAMSATTTGSWYLEGGEIDESGGGAFSTDGVATLYATNTNSTLNAVTLDSPIDFSANSFASAGITGGLTLNTALNIGSASGTTNGTLLFEGGNETLGGSGTITFGASGLNLVDIVNEQLTIGADVTINGESADFNAPGGAGTLVNDGAIDATVSGGNMIINPTTFTNNGTVEASGAAATVDPATLLNNFSSGTLTGGLWQATGGGTLRLKNGGTPVDITTNAATVVQTAIGNGGDGLDDDSGANTIGAAGAGNVISGNTHNGIEDGGDLGTLIGTYNMNYRYNTAGYRPADWPYPTPTDGNPFYGISSPGPYFVNAAPGNYKVVITAENDPISADVWNGDANSGYRTDLDSLPVGSEVDIHHTFGDLVFYAWDWYAYDNSPDSWVIANLYEANQQGGNNVIGGTTAGSGNFISDNLGDGVLIRGAATVGDAIRENSIFGNGKLGIDLGGSGTPVANDSQGHVGPNNYENFPVIDSALGGPTTVVSGSLNTTPNTTFDLDFFANNAADPSGYGQGQLYLGSATVASDSTGLAEFKVTLPGASAPGEQITTTATDSAGNTSEFSQDFAEVANDTPPVVTITPETAALAGAALAVDSKVVYPNPQDVLRYQWSVSNVGDASFVLPADTVTDEPTLRFTPPTAGSYQITLDVSDSLGIDALLQSHAKRPLYGDVDDDR